MNYKHGKPSGGFAPQVNEPDGKKVSPARHPFLGWLRRPCSCQDTRGHSTFRARNHHRTPEGPRNASRAQRWSEREPSAHAGKRTAPSSSPGAWAAGPSADGTPSRTPRDNADTPGH